MRKHPSVVLSMSALDPKKVAELEEIRARIDAIKSYKAAIEGAKERVVVGKMLCDTIFAAKEPMYEPSEWNPKKGGCCTLT